MKRAWIVMQEAVEMNQQTKGGKLQPLAHLEER